MNEYHDKCPKCGSEKVSQKVFVKTIGGRVCADCGEPYVKDVGWRGSNSTKSNDSKSRLQ